MVHRVMEDAWSIGGGLRKGHHLWEEETGEATRLTERKP